MIKSESTAKLAEALSKAQRAMKNAVKDSDNPFFKSHYADLASVREATLPALSDNGLAIVQIPETDEQGRTCVTSVLLHTTGEFIGGTLAMRPVKDDPQGAGSAITYARRYQWQGLVGIASEDDDGNAASGKIEGQQKTKVQVGDKPYSTETAQQPLPKPNGKGATKVTSGQITNFQATFKRALPKDRMKDADDLYAAYLKDRHIDFDTMSPDDFYPARDEAEAYARTL